MVNDVAAFAITTIILTGVVYWRSPFIGSLMWFIEGIALFWIDANQPFGFLVMALGLILFFDSLLRRK